MNLKSKLQNKIINEYYFCLTDYTIVKIRK